MISRGEIGQWLDSHQWTINYEYDEEPMGDAMIESLSITDQFGNIIVEDSDVADLDELAKFCQNSLQFIRGLMDGEVEG